MGVLMYHIGVVVVYGGDCVIDIWDCFREKGPNACFFKISIFWGIFSKSEMSSTYCFLRTENHSISHGVVRRYIFN